LQTFRQEKDERARDLRTIELYRSQGKRDGILNMLHQAITTEHIIHPVFSCTEFFEFVLKNPYNSEHTITIEWNDPELMYVFRSYSQSFNEILIHFVPSVITDTREWRHFKMINEVYTSVEEGMFNTETKSGQPQIFLRPKEIVHVPFKFLSYRGDHSVQPQVCIVPPFLNYS
jgi:nephrocystin-4